MTDKLPVAVVPDACTLIYASIETKHADMDARWVPDARNLMDFIERYSIGITTERILESTVKTNIAYEMSLEEKKNLARHINSLKKVDISHSEIESKMDAINGLYDRARNTFENRMKDIIEGVIMRYVSRRKGVLSGRKALKCARKIENVLNDPSYSLLRTKLYLDPPDHDDRALLAFSNILKEGFERVFVATEDTHMCPMHTCPEVGFIVPDGIRETLGVECRHPVVVGYEVEEILEKAGIIEPEPSAKTEGTLINQKSSYNSHAVKETGSSGQEKE